MLQKVYIAAYYAFKEYAIFFFFAQCLARFPTVFCMSTQR